MLIKVNVSASGILLGISSELQLLVINLASVTSGQSINSQLPNAQTLAVILHKTEIDTLWKKKKNQLLFDTCPS